MIVTVLNEVETIAALLLGLTSQTYQPAEVIIIDAGSTDDTVQLIKVFQKKHPSFPLKLIIKKGNRSAGRNFGIKLAKNEWVAITDAGCMPHTDWLEKLAQAATKSQAEVVAGYYDAAPETAFQAAVVPYMLVMPDRVNPAHFLPATRSMMIKKQVWQAVGSFDESLTLSEDYDFAHRLEQAKFKLTFTQKAKVAWWPIETWQDFYQTVMGMAQYDARAGITRIKSYLIFCRYLIFLFLAAVFFCPNWILCAAFVVVSASIYSFWAMWKNAQYLDRSWYYLPVLQIVSDWGVMVGTIKGIISSYVKRSAQA
ncbi:MAG: glycosyltransferase [Candidatus Pacebacteria bacterium]|nr:glycosyltransferase [Candidatus Paceibacterota bacterium]MBT7499213.1 glycosyltransferase [Candidatus Paceibacterota bacterium]